MTGRIERLGWKGWYSLLSWYAERRRANFHCMNWGYDDETATAAEGPERYALQLYERVVRGVELEGRRIVEISSGRGGGLAHLCEVRNPASATGVDFVPRQVAASRRAFARLAPRLTYEIGDAAATGLGAASADVVINVEASHCYPNIRGFLRETHRVLAPGGLLSWADFRPHGDVAPLRAEARKSGFSVVEDANVTRQVVAAMEADADRRRALIEAHSSPVFHSILLNFAAADRSSDTYARLAAGRYSYFLFQLRAE